MSVYWHLDIYPSRAAAEAAKGHRGTIVESMDKIWLLTIADETWRPIGGEHIAEIGPITVTAGIKYTAQYMEGINVPGGETAVHHHSGSEVFYMMSGEACMETPQGKSFGRPGGKSIIVPPDTPHKLTITGTEERRGLMLVLHDSSRPWVTRTHEHGWVEKGICKGS